MYTIYNHYEYYRHYNNYDHYNLNIEYNHSIKKAISIDVKVVIISAIAGGTATAVIKVSSDISEHFSNF